jgi:quercetin dioxygenase-like cupin family protein
MRAMREWVTAQSQEESMKTVIRCSVGTLLVACAIGLGTGAALAQDPTKVDAKHYAVTFENDQVRILRITYGAGEKSVVHEHPNSIAVFLTDGKVKFTLPDGTSQQAEMKAGQAIWNPAGKHLPENLGDKPFELVLVEMKK